KWPHYDDLGGAVDNTDDSVTSTIIREAMEETNNMIDINHIINSKCNVFYNHFSKYYSFAIKITNGSYNDTNIFGDMEIHDNIKRTINWYTYKEVKDNLAYRMRNNAELINFLNNL